MAEPHSKDSEKNAVDGKFLSRVVCLWRIVYDGCLYSRITLIALCTFSLFNIWVVSLTGTVIAEFYGSITSLDEKKFFHALGLAVIVIVITALLDSILKFLIEMLGCLWRRRLTSYVQDKYFHGLHYYRVLNVVDNPDQRITQDVDNFTSTLSSIIGSVINVPLNIAFYTYKTSTGISWYAPVAVYLFFITGYIINKFIMTTVVGLVFKQEMLEGNFRFAHVRIRAAAEAIAFYRGQDCEKSMTHEKFSNVIDNQFRLARWHLILNSATNIFTYTATILNYSLVAMAVMFFPSQPFLEYLGGDLNSDGYDSSMVSAFIAVSTFNLIMLAYGFSEITNLSVPFSDLAGYTARVMQLLEVLENLKETSWQNGFQDRDDGDFDEDASRVVDESGKIGLNEYAEIQNQRDRRKLALEPSRMVFQNKDYVEMEKVSCVVEGKTIFSNVSFRMEVGNNLLIMGPPGCGKSSILRVLNGVWKMSAGSITKPSNMFYIPQIPYLPLGDIVSQVIYPVPVQEMEVIEEETILRILDMLKLTHLLERAPFHSVSTPVSRQQRSPSASLLSRDGVVNEATLPLLNSSRAPSVLPNSEEYVVVTPSAGMGYGSQSSSSQSRESTYEGLSLASVEGEYRKEKEESVLVHWTETLSPGERQLLSLSRLFYHLPQFAVLDEATSSLSEPMESLVYSLCKKFKISTISVGHRETLRRYHNKLFIKEGSGWNLHDMGQVEVELGRS